MARNLSRIKALIELYQYDLLNEDITIDTFDNLLEEVSDTDVDKTYSQKFTDELVNGVINNKNKIDYMIAINLEKYPLDRLSYIDRSLLRIGTYEMMFTKTPHQVVINEIVNLSKEYSQTDDFLSSKFNNSVLDKISKMINE